MPYQLFANLVLALHIAIVAFVIAGLVLVLLGNWRGWSWVNHWWFRALHLGAIGVVVAESWFGLTCPLTTLEMWLRSKAHQVTYAGGFIEHWMQELLYYDAPAWVFVLCYTAFGLIVLATWWRFPPHSKRKPAQ